MFNKPVNPRESKNKRGRFEKRELPVIVVEIRNIGDVGDRKVLKVESGFPVNVVDFRPNRVESSVLDGFLEFVFHTLLVVFLRHPLHSVK